MYVLLFIFFSNLEKIILYIRANIYIAKMTIFFQNKINFLQRYVRVLIVTVNHHGKKLKVYDVSKHEGIK